MDCYGPWRLNTEIKNLGAEISKNTAALDKATAIRQKELAESHGKLIIPTIVCSGFGASCVTRQLLVRCARPLRVHVANSYFRLRAAGPIGAFLSGKPWISCLQSSGLLPSHFRGHTSQFEVQRRREGRASVHRCPEECDRRLGQAPRRACSGFFSCG